MTNEPPTWLPFIIVPLVPAFFVTLSALISTLGGWRALAERCGCQAPASVAGRRYYWSTINLNYFTAYRGCINVMVAESGFIMEPIFMFRFMHPPVYIKWENIESAEFKPAFLRQSILKVENARIAIYGNVGADIYEAYEKYLQTASTPRR